MPFQSRENIGRNIKSYNLPGITQSTYSYGNMRLLFLSLLFTCTYASQCQLDHECKEGVCRDGICEKLNPFSKGCLQTLAGRNLDAEHYNLRVCNSADGKESNDCIPPKFEYDEVRIAPGNWESSILVSTCEPHFFHRTL